MNAPNTTVDVVELDLLLLDLQRAIATHNKRITLSRKIRKVSK